MKIVGLEAGGLGHDPAVRELLADHRRQLRHPREPSLEVHLDRDVAERGRLDGLRRRPPLARERERRPDRGMPRERQLGVRREDPHPVAVGARLGHERGLGEVRLERQHLHLLGRAALGGLGDDAESIALERRLGERVDEPEPDVHRRSIPAAIARLAPFLAGVAQW